jgi:YegS/Rv2252/BmrU family lipid kinase
MYYFIVNPGSRSGQGKLTWQSIEQVLEAERIEYRVFFTAYRYHAIQLAKEITSRGERLTLVAVGGDGTVNEVINGIQDFSKVTFAYVPTGSSNDFARSLGLPSSPEEAIRNIVHPTRCSRIDLGQISFGDRSRYFAVSCGTGFDAAVCQEALASSIKNLLNKLKLGKLTYVGIALKQILMFRPLPMKLTLDGNRSFSFPRTYFIAAMNCRYEGGGLKFTPKAKVDDGLLDICVVEGLSKLIIALMFPTAYLGKHTIFKGIHIYRAKELDLELGRETSSHTDGEAYYLKEPLHISCVPRCLTIIC